MKSKIISFLIVFTLLGVTCSAQQIYSINSLPVCWQGQTIYKSVYLGFGKNGDSFLENFIYKDAKGNEVKPNPEDLDTDCLETAAGGGSDTLIINLAGCRDTTIIINNDTIVHVWNDTTIIQCATIGEGGGGTPDVTCNDGLTFNIIAGADGKDSLKITTYTFWNHTAKECQTIADTTALQCCPTCACEGVTGTMIGEKIPLASSGNTIFDISINDMCGDGSASQYSLTQNVDPLIGFVMLNANGTGVFIPNDTVTTEPVFCMDVYCGGCLIDNICDTLISVVPPTIALEIDDSDGNAVKVGFTGMCEDVPAPETASTCWDVPIIFKNSFDNQVAFVLGDIEGCGGQPNTIDFTNSTAGLSAADQITAAAFFQGNMGTTTNGNGITFDKEALHDFLWPILGDGSCDAWNICFGDSTGTETITCGGGTSTNSAMVEVGTYEQCARFNQPLDGEVDQNGILYFAEFLNNQIRSLDLQNGCTETICNINRASGVTVDTLAAVPTIYYQGNTAAANNVGGLYKATQNIDGTWDCGQLVLQYPTVTAAGDSWRYVEIDANRYNGEPAFWTSTANNGVNFIYFDGTNWVNSPFLLNAVNFPNLGTGGGFICNNQSVSGYVEIDPNDPAVFYVSDVKSGGDADAVFSRFTMTSGDPLSAIDKADINNWTADVLAGDPCTTTEEEIFNTTGDLARMGWLQDALIIDYDDSGNPIFLVGTNSVEPNFDDQQPPYYIISHNGGSDPIERKNWTVEAPFVANSGIPSIDGNGLTAQHYAAVGSGLIQWNGKIYSINRQDDSITELVITTNKASESNTTTLLSPCDLHNVAADRETSKY